MPRCDGEADEKWARILISPFRFLKGFLDFRELGVIFPKGWLGLAEQGSPAAGIGPRALGFAKLRAVNWKLKLKSAFGFSAFGLFVFGFLFLHLPGLGNFKSINPKARYASFFASPILISNALVLSFIFWSSQSRSRVFAVGACAWLALC